MYRYQGKPVTTHLNNTTYMTSLNVLRRKTSELVDKPIVQEPTF